MRYAIVDANGIVQNLIEWDGVSNWSPPVNMTAQLAPNMVVVNPGWAWNNGAPINPNPPPVPPTPPAPPDMSLLANHAPAIQALASAIVTTSPTPAIAAVQLQNAFASAWKALPAAVISTNPNV
jgi:hypothetical protein